MSESDVRRSYRAGAVASIGPSPAICPVALTQQTFALQEVAGG